MKVVLDTNIVVSAFLTPGGKPATVLQLVLNQDLEIAFNTAILAEYEGVLCRSKFAGRVHQPAISRFFEIVYTFGKKVEVNPSLMPLPDETDRKFYDAAKASGSYLITGNLKHYPFDDPSIMLPADFLKFITVSF